MLEVPPGFHALFVYGTLKNPKANDDFYVTGKLFDLGSFPGIKLDGDKRVPGQIALISEKRLQSLDVYEGVPSLYTREKTKAFSFEDESAINVWVYQFARDVEEYEEIEKW